MDKIHIKNHPHCKAPVIIDMYNKTTHDSNRKGLLSWLKRVQNLINILQS